MKRLLMFMFCSGILSGTASACNAQLATYHQIDAPEFRLSFAKMPNPKAWSDIQAQLKSPARTFDFEFTASNGYEVLSMVSLDDASKDEPSISVVFFDTDLKSVGLPQSGEAAPDYLVINGLGPWLWYGGFEPREYLPNGMWKLDECRSN